MYKVYIDGSILHDPTLDDPALLVADAEVKKQANAADTFTFTVYPDNPICSEINKLTSVVEVTKDDKLIFRGRPIQSADGWENQRTFVCEGDLAFLNDSVMRPYDFQGSVRDYLQSLITSHNNQMPAAKQFTLRTVTVTDPNNNIVRSNGNYTTTMQEIQQKLVNSLGGYLVIERSGGRWYLDYLADSSKATGQTITISKNLIDFAREANAENIATGIIPLGATNEETGLPITIESVNSGKDYIVDETAAAQYGLIFVTETWDDVTIPANLLTKARARLTQYTKLAPTITLTAVDLSVTDEDIDPIECLDYVTVQDDAHEASGRYLVMSRTYNLNDPSKDTVTFGGEQESIARTTSRTAYETSEMPARILKNASARAKEILDSSTDGNIYFRYNDAGKVYEIDFLNTESIETATQMWRWNLGGWGYSNDGGETYITAATMDGAILASMITTGILKSDDGTTFYLDLDNGVLKGNFSELKISGSSAASQSYADQAEADAVSTAASNTSTAISNYDTSLNQQVVFNKLTNNKANQGIYLSGGNLYINASMINSGYISAARIEANSIAVSKLTGSISNGNWKIDLDNGTFTIGNISASNITTGTLSADRIAANSIAVGKLTGSISNGNWKIDLNAGTFTIGNIAANNITAGTITASVTATNLKMTGGSINISTGNESMDVISMGYTITGTSSSFVYKNVFASGYSALSLTTGGIEYTARMDAGIFAAKVNGVSRMALDTTGLRCYNDSGSEVCTIRPVLVSSW